MVVTTRRIGILFAAFALGIFLGNFWSDASLLVSALLLLGFLSILVFIVKKSPRTLEVAILLACIAAGVLAISSVLPVRTEFFDGLVGVEHEFSGYISSQPDQRISGAQYVLSISHVDGNEVEDGVHISLSLPKYPLYAYGDHLTFSGKLKVPEDFSIDPLRPPFPYVDFLAKDGIGYVVRFPKVLFHAEREYFSVRGTLSEWKRAIALRVNSIFEEPEGGLLSGILLGEKHALPDDVLEDLRTAGLVHVIVVSGYNMTIVAEWVGRFFRFAPLQFRSSIGILFIWIYAGMVGGGAPVIRASIMTSLALFARMTGRTGDALRLLLLAVFVMLIQNPRILRDDPSFHLSFLATLGLILIAPHIATWLGWKKHPRTLDLISSTLSAQIAVVPYILSFSGLLSPYGLVANLLVLPLVPLAMGLGTITLFLSVIHPMIGLLGAFLTTPLLSWTMVVAQQIARLPGSHASISFFPFWVSGLVYLVLGFFLWKGNAVHVAKKEKHDH